MMSQMRLIYMGTPDFAVPALGCLLDAGHEVACVYTQPPRPAGRGHKERPSPVHAFAREKGLEVRCPKSLKDQDEHKRFAGLQADVCVVAAYGLILPAPVLKAPRLGCLNIHASLLPRWRGAAPIQRAIMAGDSQTGITIMQMDEGLDTGDMLLQRETPISTETTAQELHDCLADMGGSLIVEALNGLVKGNLTPTRQPDDGVTYAEKLVSAEGRLDWSRTAEDLERMVRALNPWPGVWFEHEGRRIRVLTSEVSRSSKTGTSPGTVVDDHLGIACHHGVLKPTRVQLQGKKPMDTKDFLRGYKLERGCMLPSA